MAENLTYRAKLLFVVTEDWYFVSHRLELAKAAKTAGYDVSVATHIHECGDLIRSSGIKLIPFRNSRGGVNPIVEFWTLLRLILLYRHERPDLVHHVALKPVIYGSISALFSPNTHVINAIAGMGWMLTSSSGLSRWLKSSACHLLSLLLRKGTVLVQNPDDARLLERMGVPMNHIHRIPGAGVDLSLFKPDGERPGDPIVLLPARLLWDKGVGEFIDAARLLKKQGVAARFILAGAPDPANPSSISQNQISEWVDEGIVEYLGWVTDVPQLMSESHIVCLPSYYGEGIPKSLIEAAAAGRPIVTTDMPGCREIVQPEDNGILVPPKDSLALANALTRLINDPVLRRQMGDRGRIRAETEFSLELVVDHTLALYAEALS